MFNSNFKDNFSSGVSFLKKKMSVTNLLEGEQSDDPSLQLQHQQQQLQQQQQVSQQQQQLQQQQQQYFPHQQQQQQQTQFPQKPPPPLPQREPSMSNQEASNPFKIQPQPNIQQQQIQQHQIQQQQQQWQQQQQQQQQQQPAHQRFMPSSMSGTMQSMVKAASQAVSQASEAIKTVPGKRNAKILLIVDEPHTDWSRMFYGRKVHEDMDVQVEQAQFSDIRLTSSSDGGLLVEIRKNKSETFQRSFKPDFALVRQHVRDATSNHKKVLLGLHYGKVPCINSALSLYNFLDKPWVFAHLIKIQRRLGQNEFPLITQCYYPNFNQMLVASQFPVVVKVGHAHGGSGKIKVDNHYAFQDIASATALANTYSTTEGLLDCLYDILIQKTGTTYKAFMRRSTGDSWNADTGSVTLEQVAMNEKYKMWVDECSRIFGGLDMLSLQVVQSRDGRQFIIEVNDSTMTSLGGSQSDDYRNVVDLVIEKMNSTSTPSRQRGPTFSGSEGPDFAAAFDGANRPPMVPARTTQDTAKEVNEGEEDTVQNFKKTFAGIFSNM